MAPSTPSGMNRFYLLLGAVLLAGAGILYYLVARPKAASIPANVTVLATDTAGFRGYVIGSDSAPVEVTEYADYQCPACGDFALVQYPSVRETLIATGRVRYRFRDFPLDQIHPHARLAAHAAACADDQGKFWEMNERIFQAQMQWSPRRDASGIFRDLAGQAGVELGAYDACMSSAKHAGRIEASLREGVALGVGSTPTFLIGGRLYAGALGSDSIKALVERAAAGPSAGQ